MSNYDEIVDGLYLYITERLGVASVTVAFGGWYAIVSCESPQDEHLLMQAFQDGWNGVPVAIRKKRKGLPRIIQGACRPASL